VVDKRQHTNREGIDWNTLRWPARAKGGGGGEGVVARRLLLSGGGRTTEVQYGTLTRSPAHEERESGPGEEGKGTGLAQ
jgi:hypothetical protein